MPGVPRSCALRPDRLGHMLRTLTEHVCIKRRLEAAMHRQFDRLCLLPAHVNKCFDWDVAGTRWQRVGLSLAEAYKALGLRTRASNKDVRVAYHRMALANHPDKVAGKGKAAEAEAKEREEKMKRLNNAKELLLKRLAESD